MAENENRQRALEDALKKIEKSYGKGAVMKLGEKVDTQIQTVSSGSLALDIALGVGGFPRGRIIEVYGPESSGKTTVALHAVAEVQKRGGVAAFIDAEHALDPESVSYTHLPDLSVLERRVRCMLCLGPVCKKRRFK